MLLSTCMYIDITCCVRGREEGRVRRRAAINTLRQVLYSQARVSERERENERESSTHARTVRELLGCVQRTAFSLSLGSMEYAYIYISTEGVGGFVGILLRDCVHCALGCYSLISVKSKGRLLDFQGYRKILYYISYIVHFYAGIQKLFVLHITSFTQIRKEIFSLYNKSSS